MRVSHEDKPSFVKEGLRHADRVALHDLTAFTAAQSKPWPSLGSPSPNDGVERRYSRDFTRRERMDGVNMSLAGTKNRKSIRWKQDFQITFIHHTWRNLMLEDTSQPRWRSMLRNQLGKVGFSS